MNSMKDFISFPHNDLSVTGFSLGHPVHIRHGSVITCPSSPLIFAHVLVFLFYRDLDTFEE